MRGRASFGAGLWNAPKHLTAGPWTQLDPKVCLPEHKLIALHQQRDRWVKAQWVSDLFVAQFIPRLVVHRVIPPDAVASCYVAGSTTTPKKKKW
jgi:hypothetical protein